MSDLSFSVNIPDGASAAAFLNGIDLGVEVHGAMIDIETQLIGAAQGNMNWKNPSGDLEDSIATDSSVPNNWTAIVGTSLPYGRRREFGFSGLTDSLGRYFKDDPGKPYLQPALDSNTGYIEDRVSQAVSKATTPPS
jgi:phage gpG-like protein